MTTKEKDQLEELCQYSEICADSDYGNRETCSSDPETCENYFLFEEGSIIIEKLPQGIHHGEIKTHSEKCFRSQNLETKKTPK